ncbi:heparinase II/III family protein [Brachybacterium halotolerans subsp. kimchii]|uniref:heparinase II/III family protein n=1 Tax=Brachybacterium halotolerans TaxID=2795215 RepID=UPI001E2E5101|nr:heparinase II/III family protein [Brachybacterium halotolerans]UEJ81408.1 heparinase II/III family protein [Brachybacterium halotolerans subsp. kimchii]
MSPVEPDWGAVRSRVRERTWAGEILSRVREDFARWDAALRIPGPSERTEWTHHYFCDDGTRLEFDPSSPTVHRCPTCGSVRRGEPYDGAWRTTMHNLVASHAQRAALLIRLEDDSAAQAAGVEALERIIAHYATTYTEHPLHGDKVGQGRVMPQNLDEAIWAIALLRAVRWAEPELPVRVTAHAEQLASAVVRVLEPQLAMVHNIHCWILAALAECSARTGDAALRERVHHGPFGIAAQIREGFRAEGIWYETSLFYHYYALSALLSYREATGPDGLSDAEDSALRRAITAPAHLAYSDGLLPAYGDCWPRLRMGDVSGIEAAADAILLPAPAAAPAAALASVPPGDGEIRAGSSMDDRARPVELWIGAQWDGGTGSRPLTGPHSVAELVFGRRRPASGFPGPGVPGGPGARPTEPSDEAALRWSDDAERSSFLWADAGIAVLRSERARLTLRFGPDAGMHDHHDKLAVDAETAGGWRSLDLGSGGYTSAMTRWTRSAAAHSIGIVHDEAQPALDGVLDSWSPEHVSARIVWRERSIHRTLRLTPEGWTDSMRMTADAPGPLLWLLHGDGEVLGDAHAVDARELGSPPGAEFLKDVRRLRIGPQDTLDVSFSAPGAPRVRVPMPPGARAYAAGAPGNPTGGSLGILAIRMEESTQMDIEAHVRVDPVPRAPAIRRTHGQGVPR